MRTRGLSEPLSRQSKQNLAHENNYFFRRALVNRQAVYRLPSLRKALLRIVYLANRTEPKRKKMNKIVTNHTLHQGWIFRAETELSRTVLRQTYPLDGGNAALAPALRVQFEIPGGVIIPNTPEVRGGGGHFYFLLALACFPLMAHSADGGGRGC